MNCNEFKEKVADLFDKTIDINTQMLCEEHMANCPECKAYYDELRETFNMLQPQVAVGSTKRKASQKLWRYVAAAVIFLFGFVIGWNHLFSTPAVAEDTRISFLQEGIQRVQNVGSFQMEVYMRTTPQENFSYLDPAMPFVKTDISLLRQNDSVFYRVEKNGGRTVVSDGSAAYMWIPGVLYLKGKRETNFLEHFTDLMFPEQLLNRQKSAFALSKENKVTQTETDSTVVLTFEGMEKDIDLQQLLKTGEMGECCVAVENTFTKNDGLLRFVKLWIIKDGKKTMLLHVDNIRYNVMLNRNDMTRLPATQWTDITQQEPTNRSHLVQLQKETATQAAERILNAIITGNDSIASEALVYYKSVFTMLSQKMKGCKVSNFNVRTDSSYAGVYVFYTLTTPDGKDVQSHITLRNDNEESIWMVDGGL